MTDLRPVSATEFARNFARHQDEVLAGATLKVTRHGRVVGDYISARDLDPLDADVSIAGLLAGRERAADRRVSEAPNRLRSVAHAGRFPNLLWGVQLCNLTNSDHEA